MLWLSLFGKVGGVWHNGRVISSNIEGSVVSALPLPEPATVTGRSEVGGCDSSQLVGNIALSLPAGSADDGSAVGPWCCVQ